MFLINELSGTTRLISKRSTTFCFFQKRFYINHPTGDKTWMMHNALHISLQTFWIVLFMNPGWCQKAWQMVNTMHIFHLHISSWQFMHISSLPLSRATLYLPISSINWIINNGGKYILLCEKKDRITSFSYALICVKNI